ncbi:MAG: hypothetical protein HYY57_01355, partial [Candidatus Omnitrophica bacterium]|nr:hypothetical protein [Candidatus Omnitrophota bacterium]
MQRWNLLVKEFTHHFPYTLVGSLIAMAAAWGFGVQYLDHGHSEALFVQSRALFHFFH